MEDPAPHSRFFQNRQCEYFPCHSGVAEADFNCLFCFCPLYALGSRCGGAYRYTPQGDKDCSHCTFPHRPENYDKILARWADIRALAARESQPPEDDEK